MAKDQKDFTSSIIDKKSGDILGGLVNVPIPRELAGLVDSAVDYANDFVAPRLEQGVEAVARGSMSPFVKDSDKLDRRIKLASTVAGYGFSQIKTLIAYYKSTTGFRKEFTQTAQKLDRVFRANDQMGGVLGVMKSDNKVIANARKKVSNNFGKSVSIDTISILKSLPLSMAKKLRDDEKKGIEEGFVHKIPGLGKSEEDKRKIARADELRIKKIQDKKNFSNKDSNELSKLLREIPSAKDQEDKIKKFGIPLANLTGKVLEDNVAKKLFPEGSSYMAYDMIMHLSELSKKERGVQSVADKSVKAHGKAVFNTEVSIERYVREIFQQHLRDSGFEEIGERRLEKLDEMVAPIADAIKKGDLDPLALVNLVGDEKLLGEQGTFMASERAAMAEVEHQLKILPYKETYGVKKFYSDYAYTKDDMRQILANLKGEEKSFFVSVMPDDVLIAAGMKQKEIIETRATYKKTLCEKAVNMVTELGKMDKETLEKLNLTDSEIKYIQGFEKDLQKLDEEKRPEYIDRAIKGCEQNKQGVRQALRSEPIWKIMVEGKQQKPTSFVERVAAKPANNNEAEISA